MTAGHSRRIVARVERSGTRGTPDQDQTSRVPLRSTRATMAAAQNKGLLTPHPGPRFSLHHDPQAEVPMSHARHAYLPAAGLDALLPLYDPFVKLLGADRVRAHLLDQAALQPQHRILDVGCGTGTLL